LLRPLKEAAKRLDVDYRQLLKQVHLERIDAINLGSVARPRWYVAEHALDAFTRRKDNVAAEDAYRPKPSKFFG